MPGPGAENIIEAANVHAAAEDAERRDSQEVQIMGASEPHHNFQKGGPADKEFEKLGEGIEDFPSEEDLHTLRRVAAHIQPKLFTIAFIEACERFSYYGSVAVVCLTNSLRS